MPARMWCCSAAVKSQATGPPEAATIAATYSKAAEGVPAPVDYTQVKNVKKPPGTKPGYVTYKTNRTAYVVPDQELCEKLKIEKA